jgi:hypothetical protein
MHLPHVPGHHSYPQPPGQFAGGFHSLAQGFQGHQFQLSDAIVLADDQGSQSIALDLEFGAGFVVIRFPKARKSFKPVHRSLLRSLLCRANTSDVSLLIASLDRS